MDKEKPKTMWSVISTGVLSRSLQIAPKPKLKSNTINSYRDWNDFSDLKKLNIKL